MSVVIAETTTLGPRRRKSLLLDGSDRRDRMATATARDRRPDFILERRTSGGADNAINGHVGPRVQSVKMR